MSAATVTALAVILAGVGAALQATLLAGLALLLTGGLLVLRR